MSANLHPETVELSDFAAWQPVATANGPLAAAVIVGRLQSAGIPAWARHESAGPAIGLSLGPLSYSQIMVPAEKLAEAETLLAEEPPAYDEPLAAEDLAPVEPGRLEKAVMLAAAFTINSLGTVIAIVLAPLLGAPGAEYIVCPGCQAEITLSVEEMDAGWATCPTCAARVEFE